MSNLNTIGVDLAKNIIQVSVVCVRGKELVNKALTRAKFAEFLGKQQPSMVAFEACATAHYWARVAKRHDHKVKIIPARAVFPFRQGHKTDQNDAVAEAAVRPTIKEAPLKNLEQQGTIDTQAHAPDSLTDFPMNSCLWASRHQGMAKLLQIRSLRNWAQASILL